MSGDDWGPSARAWNTLVARSERHGTALFRSDPDDGQQVYFTVTGATVRVLRDLAALECLLDHADAAQAARFDAAHAEALGRERSSVIARSDAEWGP